MVFETVLVSDLQKMVNVKQLSGNLFSADNGGNKITVEILDGGAPATVTGAVYGYAIREDGKTVIMEGSLSGNKASIILPASAYAVIGKISIVVKVGTATVGACQAYVYRTTTDAIVDPGSIVPDISELLAQIGACEQATEAATAAATEAGYVNIASSKNNKVITIVTTNRNNQSTSTTITEPTMTVSESDGVVTVTCTDADGTTTVSFDTTDIDDEAGYGDTTKAWSADKDVKELDKKAPAILVEDSTAAAVKTFPDGADGMAMALLVGVEPVQDLHGYDNPWPGGGSKNLLPNEITSYTERDVTFTTLANGKIKINGTSSGSIYQHNICSEFSLPEGTYIFSYDAVTNCNVQITNRAGSVEYFVLNSSTPSKTITVTSTEANDMKVRFSISSGVTINNAETGVMIRVSTDSDATFAPYSNICPISGWTGAKVTRKGVNQIDEEWVSGYLNEDGSVTSASGYLCSKNYNSILPNTMYYITMPDNSRFMAFYDKNKQFISRVSVTRNDTFTSPSNAYYMKIDTNGSYGNTYNHDISVNYPSTEHDYNAYAGKEYQITFPTSAGTVYGGTVKVEKDGTGKLIVDMKRTVLNYDADVKVAGSVPRYQVKIADMKYQTDATALSKAITSNLEPVTDTYFFTGSADNVNKKFSISADGYFRFGLDNSIDNYQKAKTWLGDNNVELVYELATPIEYDLTPGQVKALLGINNIWADTGDIEELTYPADTRMYIERRLAEIVNALS